MTPRMWILPVIAALLVGMTGTGCSIRKLAINKVADALSSEGGTVFIGEDDPELVAQALPFSLKMYESVLQETPNNPKLLLATGKAFCMYAYAFVQSPAERLTDDKIDEQKHALMRAKKLHLRGRDYILRGLDVRHPGFRKLVNSNHVDSALALTTIADTSYLYWAAASWMGAFTADKFDLGLMMGVPKAVAFMNKALTLSDTYGQGSVHEFFISYYGAMPASMGGSDAKAREHFKRAVEIAGGVKAGPFVSLATSVCVKNQNLEEFTSLLEQALSVDLNASPQNRLVNILSQDKARWLLDNADRFFLTTEPQPGDSLQ